MRVLYLNYEWDPRESTGALTHVRELSRGLTALGHDVRVVERHRIRRNGPAAPGRAPGRDATDPDGRWKELLRPFLHEAAALVRALRGISLEARLIREVAPDIVLTRHSLHQFSSIVAARRCGVPVVYEVNAPAPYEYRHYRKQYWLVPRFAEWLEARMLARTDGMFVVSEVLRQHFVREGVRADRIIVVPNGADVARFHPGAGDPAVRSRLGETSVVVGFVGSFARFHGIEQLQHAIDFLCRRRPEVRFLLVGAGEMSGDLKAHCVREGLEDRVHFSGHVPPDRVPALMASADILLAPYTAQEFFYLSPIKIFEYMAVGRALLAARVGQIGEVIEDGVTGILYDPADPASLSAGLLRLAEDPGLRRRLGDAARKVAEERYTWQAAARSVSGLLEDAAARHGGSRAPAGHSTGSFVHGLRSLRYDVARVYREAEAGRCVWAVAKRIGKIGMALLVHLSGLGGPLLRHLLRSSDAAILLGYHGLTREVGGLFDSGYAVSNVAGLLKHLSRHLKPLPLEALAGPVAAGQAPPAASFSVTFDDGLVNHVTLAVPMMEALGLHATYFIPSGLVGSSRDLWVSTLKELIRTMPGDSLPAEPGLWPELPLGSAARRYETLHTITAIVKSHDGRQEEILARLARVAGGMPRISGEDRVVGPEGVVHLARPGRSVGSHSRNHRILSSLDAEQAREEISGSRQDLERLVGAEVKDFAFPNGRFGDFNETTRRLVAEAGFRCALTTEPGIVRAGDDPLALRRFIPENVPAFLAAFDLLIRVFEDRNRPADGVRPLTRRLSRLGPAGTEAAA